MNEQFQNYIMGILEQTGEFLGAEIPEIANQILMFNLAVSLLCSVVGLGLAASSIRSWYVFFKIEGECDDWDVTKVVILGFLGGILGAKFLTYIVDALEIW